MSVETSQPKAVSMLDTDTFLTAIYLCGDYKEGLLFLKEKKPL
jgi:hypothetical protein